MHWIICANEIEGRAITTLLYCAATLRPFVIDTVRRYSIGMKIDTRPVHYIILK
jgi:hypothetical protein